jgi:hypothetical protein
LAHDSLKMRNESSENLFKYPFRSDSRDLSVRYPADRIRVSAWFCQNLSEVPACYLGITRGRVRTFYLPVLPLYGFTKLYTNPFLIIYLLPDFKLLVLVLFWGLEQKKQNSGSHTIEDCTDARHRHVLAFLVSILYSEKPNRIIVTMGNTIFGALNGGRKVNWARIIANLVI